MKEIKLEDFQYKITNKILVTKYFLHRINKINNNLYHITTLVSNVIQPLRIFLSLTCVR